MAPPGRKKEKIINRKLNGKRKASKASRKNKKPDKIHGQRKGEKGTAAAYVTRSMALVKLQVSLADFRRLCILKGIYPRDPKKKLHGSDKTYYHAKDIKFLQHEPLLAKFFELQTFMKKWKRLMGRHEEELAAGLEKRKPKYTLAHLVRERYPSFDDALRDMDDAVSMLSLFQSLPANQRREIPPEAVNEASRLYQEFLLYVIRAQALRKVFASVKGYYFQVEVGGQTVTWLAPHQFAQSLPQEVDFRVMLTFLEFYRALLKFVNFKLYADLGMAYPPRRDAVRDAAAAEVGALEAEMREAGRAREALAEESGRQDAEIAESAAADFGAQSEEAAELQKRLSAAGRMKSTFRGLKVFVGREVPLKPFHLTLLCGGVAEVGWERGERDGQPAPGSAFLGTSEEITHQLVDRPPDQMEKRPGREYVQPQWVLDSFNMGCTLPVAPYAPGRTPPPHLSPFVDDEAEGYVPRQREILNSFAAEAAGVASADGSAGASAEGAGAARSEGTFEHFSKELKAEMSGVWHSEFKQQKEEEAPAEGAAAQGSAEGQAAEEDDALPEGAKPAPKVTDEEEEKLRAKALMSKKHRRLLSRIENTSQRKSDEVERLTAKRRRQEESKTAP